MSINYHGFSLKWYSMLVRILLIGQGYSKMVIDHEVMVRGIWMPKENATNLMRICAPGFIEPAED